MARQPTLVQLSDELLAALDERAAREGVRRSVLIRVAIERLLAEGAAGAIDAAIVDGYRRLPPPATDGFVVDAARASIAAEPW